MKTIGLIGGMSWESTVTYYKLLNEAAKDRLGGLHSAKILLFSLEFSEIEACQVRGDWDRCADILADAAKKLEGAGADLLLICTNTMHKVAPQVKAAVSIPLIHIADATADALLAQGIHKTALLGTAYTMTQDFYKQRLIDRGIEVVIPNEADVALVHRVIFDELCLGIIRSESRREFARIIGALKAEGAQAVILGCTEVGMLVSQEDSVLPVFDTTVIHAEAAANAALSAI